MRYQDLTHRCQAEDTNMARTATQTKPLYEITKRPSNSSSANTKPVKSALSEEVPHSMFSAGRSKQYHKNVGNVNTRAVDRLNPTTAVPAHRSYPGLANG
jgi:hypothetical protein